MSGTDPIGNLNPLTYRGYICDQETGLYYLQSRYYNPQWGRFINGDAQLNNSLGILGLHQFSYCLNNPVIAADYGGNKPGDKFDSIDEAARDAALYIGVMSFENGWEYAVSIYSIICYDFTVEYIDISVFSWFKFSLPIIVFTKSIKYTYTEAYTNQDAWKVNIPKPPNSANIIAAVHTHPMGSGVGKTRFSNYVDENGNWHGDIPVARKLNILIYVYGPNGEMRKFDPSTGEDILLYTDLPVSSKKPWLN